MPEPCLKIQVKSSRPFSRYSVACPKAVLSAGLYSRDNVKKAEDWSSVPAALHFIAHPGEHLTKPISSDLKTLLKVQFED